MFRPAHALFCALTCILTPALFAQEDAMVVTETSLPLTVVATKTEKTANEVLPSVDTLSGGDLRTRQLYQLEDVLRFQPGGSVVQSGQTGSQTSLFIRGMESNHAVVLLNGRRLAPGLAGLYNLELLDTSFLDSVQIQRGPVSSLYGSDALAGAIDLRMADARRLEEGLSASPFVEGGSFNTIRAGSQVAARQGPLGVVFDLSFVDTDNDRPVNEFRNLNLRTNVSYEIADQTWIDLLGFYQNSRLEVPGSTLSAFFPETQLNENESGLLSPRFTIERDDWDFSTFYSYNTSELEATEDVFMLDNQLEQDSHEIEAQLNVRPNDDTTLTLGGGWFGYEFSRTPLIPSEFNTASSAEFGYWSIFGQADLDLPANFNLIGSGRYDGHDSFDSKATWAVTLSNRLEATNTQFFGRAATGYKAPSGQDFVFLDPSVDPSTIRPEESFSWEAGVRQFLPQDLGSIAVTYFNADIDNLVDSLGFPAFPAIVDTKTQGIEVEATLDPTAWLRLYGNYTWLDATIDKGLYFGGFAGGPGDRLPRRPEHTAAGGFVVHNDDWKLGAEIRGAAGRLDVPDIQLGDYAVARVFGSYQVNETFEIFGRMENVFDENYEALRGYDASGFGAFGGVRITY